MSETDQFRQYAEEARRWVRQPKTENVTCIRNYNPHLRGSNLAQFELLAGDSTIALTELEREFVEASTAANDTTASGCASAAAISPARSRRRSNASPTT